MKNFKKKWISNTLQIGFGLCVALFFGVNTVNATEITENFDSANDNDDLSVITSDFDFNPGAGSEYVISNTFYHTAPNGISGVFNFSAGDTEIRFGTSTDIYFSYYFYIPVDIDETQNWVLFYSSQNPMSWTLSTGTLLALELAWDDFDSTHDYCNNYSGLTLFSYTKDSCSYGGDQDCECEILYQNISFGTWHHLEIYFNTITGETKVKLDDSEYWNEADNILKNAESKDYVMSIQHRMRTEGNPFFYFDDFAMDLNATSSDFQNPEIEIIEYPDWEGTVEIIGTDSLVYKDDYYCTIGNECLLWFDYSNLQVGHTVYLVNDDVNRENIDLALDNTELLGGNFFSDYLTIPSSTSTITYSVCLYDYDVSKLYCDISIHWTETSVVFQKFFEDYECSTICDNISTTSDSFWDGARYGIECGFRKIICWAFVPSDDALVNFTKSINSLEKNFPFSIYRQLEKEIYEVNINSTSSVPVFDPLFPEWQNQNYEIISSSTMSTTFGDIWDNIYSLLENLVYLSFIFYIIFRIITMNKKEIEQV